MKKSMFAAVLVALGTAHGTAAAITVSCTVTSGTVLTSALGGLGYVIANGIGTSTGGATGVISCPAVSTGTGVIDSFQVLANVDYAGGPFGTTSGTSVSETLTIVGGPLNGSSVTSFISGGVSSNGVVPPVPFQIGSTLGGATSYAGFTVNVASSVTSGGPVSVSTGQVVVSYNVSAVPEPASWAMMLAGLTVLGAAAKRRKG